MQVFIRLGREVGEVCRPLFATFSSGGGEELWEGRSENDRGSGKRRRLRRRPLRLFNDASPRILSLYTYASSCGVSRGSGQSVLCCTHARIVGDGGSRAVAGSSGLINKGRTRVLSFPLSRRSPSFWGLPTYCSNFGIDEGLHGTADGREEEQQLAFGIST